MPRLLLNEDIRPLSEFRSKFAIYVKQVHDTKRPMVITQRGRSAAVLLDVGEYEALLEKLDILEAVQCAERQLEQGFRIEHSEAKRRVLEGLKK